MRILLVNPVLSTKRDELAVPLNLIYLASAIQADSRGISCVPLDLTLRCFQGDNPRLSLLQAQKRDIDDAWDRHGPFDLVGVAGLCDNFPFTIKLAEHIKKKYQTPIVLGGPHASFVSKALLESFRFVDFVIRFDGTLAIRELCAALSQRGSLSRVAGLSYRSELGRIIENPCAGHELGVLSVKPDYDVLPIREYLSMNPNLQLPVLAGTGCPYQCSYCSTSLMWQRRYRMKEPARIGAEVSRLKAQFKVRHVRIVHDNLLFRKDLALALCRELRQRGVHWDCSSRLEHLDGDRPFLRTLSRSGCKGIFIGLESGSPRIQRLIHKNADIARAASTGARLLEAGIKPVFSFIVGFPEENPRERDATIRMAFQLKVLGAERVNIGSLSPLPGTELARRKLRFHREQNGLSLKTLIPNSRGWVALLRSYPNIFSSFYYLAGHSGGFLGRAIVSRLHEYCTFYPRAFNYLFSCADLAPSKILSCLKRGDIQSVSRQIGRRVEPPHFAMFRDLLRYESLLRNMAGREARCPGRTALKTNWMERAYSLTNRAELLRSSVNLPKYLHPLHGEGKNGERRETFLCLIDMGSRVSTYGIPKELFLILKRLGKERGTPLRQVALSVIKRPASPRLVHSLRDLVKMGALR